MQAKTIDHAESNSNILDRILTVEAARRLGRELEGIKSWVRAAALRKEIVSPLSMRPVQIIKSAMDVDYAHQKEVKEREKMNAAAAVVSPSREAYKERVAEALDINRPRVAEAFKNKPLGLYSSDYGEDIGGS
ncbi:hypothetical protein SADUNF_Sadunf06G0179200 [Salix dunnii]|uniref:Uncharacterized protein n=1 Tax=Salix dunnii TaxID=1413687 RepID=A0A835N139_9ROSI|nr:hypothetical protein SADUNF_Sadunf06G0179200 [Salix dunnii]